MGWCCSSAGHAHVLRSCLIQPLRRCCFFVVQAQVIEEAPAPGISEDFRRSIGESAVAAARAGAPCCCCC